MDLPCHGKLLQCWSQPEKVMALQRVYSAPMGVARDSAITPSDAGSHLGTWVCLWENWEGTVGKMEHWPGIQALSVDKRN